MPTYEYKCDICEHKFDIYQSMKDAKLTKCPNCGKNTLKRLIGSGGGLIFKGSGFYLTDYKNKPAEKASEGISKESKKPETSTTSEPKTTETKTTTETTSKPAEKQPAAKSNKD